MSVDQLSDHPIAALFPLLDDVDMRSLADDIAAHGLIDPITLYEGMVLDGRNRYRACRLAGVEPAYRQYDGDSPVAWVVSVNLHRRHLSESQRAMVASRLATLGQGARTDLASIDAMSQDDAGELLNVSRASVQRAHEVQTHGVPELAQAVDEGRVAVSTAALLATEPVREQRTVLDANDDRAIIRRANEIRIERRDERQAVKRERVVQIGLNEAAPIDSIGPFPVLYADPPWRYDFAEDHGRQIENHYPTMSLDEIKTLEVPAGDDAVLFLWTTSPKLREGMEVLEAWGFSYVTCMVWVKDRIGMGYYARQQHELMLIGKRGALPVPDPEDRPSSVIQAPRGEHSAKPDVVYELLERMYPFLERCELFQRRPRDGWAGWGNQVGAA
jgi:N6-adenosine-specific RNA methylase IME4